MCRAHVALWCLFILVVFFFLRFLVIRSSWEPVTLLSRVCNFAFFGWSSLPQADRALRIGASHFLVPAVALVSQGSSLPLWPKFSPGSFIVKADTPVAWPHGVSQWIPVALVSLVSASVASELGADLETLLCFLGIFVVRIRGCDFLCRWGNLLAVSQRFLMICGPHGTFLLTSSTSWTFSF